MKKDLHISASFDQPDFLQDLIEQLAHRRYDMGYGNEKLPKGWAAMETSTTEAYVSGTLAIDMGSEEESIRMPFITAFSFTCTKDAKESYHLNWSSSLS